MRLKLLFDKLSDLYFLDFNNWLWVYIPREYSWKSIAIKGAISGSGCINGLPLKSLPLI
ncbi:hypothetical protein N9545_02515 [Salibacteraceae bacterium]|nr:hypothetical protein [Salibacteraceae bacterium]